MPAGQREETRANTADSRHKLLLPAAGREAAATFAKTHTYIKLEVIFGFPGIVARTVLTTPLLSAHSRDRTNVVLLSRPVNIDIPHRTPRRLRPLCTSVASSPPSAQKRHVGTQSRW
jgi:hypothetical protein